MGWRSVKVAVKCCRRYGAVFASAESHICSSWRRKTVIGPTIRFAESFDSRPTPEFLRLLPVIASRDARKKGPVEATVFAEPIRECGTNVASTRLREAAAKTASWSLVPARTSRGECSRVADTSSLISRLISKKIIRWRGKAEWPEECPLATEVLPDEKPPQRPSHQTYESRDPAAKHVIRERDLQQIRAEPDDDHDLRDHK
ncbi:hypothetical protein Bbelb_094190 [Branchiostoma belcheri]|nr:hypothetical protein Bbelb_094190 [Branchiostoma belcheri]